MTEKSCQQLSSLISTNENNTTTAKQNQNHHNTDHHLKQLNKASHKISKPIKKPPLDHHRHLHDQQQSLLQQQQNQQQQQQRQQQQQQQNQPPVYNINKSDFRNVVQKLTGSPAHERFSSTTTPPPVHPPKPPSSRLQRIRPPPLPLPSYSTSTAIPSNNPSNIVISNTISSNNGQKVSPLSPLPPLPSVHAAADSPITAYMRYLRSSNPQQAVQQIVVPSPNSGIVGAVSSQFVMPNSPLGFGSLISPSFLLSPSTAQLGFPQLTPPVSPSWRNL